MGRECPGPAPTSPMLGMNWEDSLGRVKRYPEQGYRCCCGEAPGGSSSQLLGNLLPKWMPPITAVRLLRSPHACPAEYLLREMMPLS